MRLPSRNLVACAACLFSHADTSEAEESGQAGSVQCGQGSWRPRWRRGQPSSEGVGGVVFFAPAGSDAGDAPLERTRAFSPLRQGAMVFPPFLSTSLLSRVSAFHVIGVISAALIAMLVDFKIASHIKVFCEGVHCVRGDSVGGRSPTPHPKAFLCRVSLLLLLLLLLLLEYTFADLPVESTAAKPPGRHRARRCRRRCRRPSRRGGRRTRGMTKYASRRW